MATRQLGADFTEKWKELPGKNGTGFMFWGGVDHCIYADFFGAYERAEKEKLASILIITNDELRFPYSLRIGFHETEKAARRAMMALFGAEDSESQQNNQTGS